MIPSTDPLKLFPTNVDENCLGQRPLEQNLGKPYKLSHNNH